MVVVVVVVAAARVAVVNNLHIGADEYGYTVVCFPPLKENKTDGIFVLAQEVSHDKLCLLLVTINQ